jgi:hypothetical protein
MGVDAVVDEKRKAKPEFAFARTLTRIDLAVINILHRMAPSETCGL